MRVRPPNELRRGDLRQTRRARTRRQIWLCADDYGISPAVDAAIRDLVVNGRINATSVMVAAPSFIAPHAVPLNVLNAASPRVAVGLHVTLTAPFRPLSGSFQPVRDGAFLPLETMLWRSFAHLFKHETLVIEIASQLRTLHHRIRPRAGLHRRPSARPSVSANSRGAAQRRQGCGAARLGAAMRPYRAAAAALRRPQGAAAGLAQPRLPPPRQRVRRAHQSGVRRHLRVRRGCRLRQLFPAFLDGLPEGSVVMCHPGFVDAELERLDPLTTLREREYAFLRDDGFPGVLAAHGVALA